MARKSITTAELKGLMVKAVFKMGETLSALHGSNPQILSTRAKIQAELDLAKAVLDALSGDTVALKIYAQGEESSVSLRIGKLLKG